MFPGVNISMESSCMHNGNITLLVQVPDSLKIEMRKANKNCIKKN